MPTARRLTGPITWLVCLTAVCITIWIPDYLPFTDYPVHLSLIQSAGIPGHVTPLTLDYFETQWFTPYVIPYQLGRFLAAAIPLETTGKVLLTLYLLLTPLAFARLLRSLNKPAILALGILPLLFNFNLSWGFLPFLLAVPLIFETTVRAIRYLDTPGLLNWIALSVCFLLLFFTHLFGMITAGVLVIGAAIASLHRRRRQAFLCLTAGIPAAVLTLLWQQTLVFSKSDAVFLSKGIRFAPLSLKIRFFPDYIVSGDPSRTGWIILGLFSLIILFRALPVSSPDAPPETLSLRGPVAAGMLSALVVFYLICPYSWLTAVWLFHRLAFMIPAFVICMLPIHSRCSRSAWILMISAVTIWLGLTTVERYRLFNLEAVSGAKILHQIPPGRSLRYIPVNSRSRFTDHNPYEHFGQYYMIHQNGFVLNPFATLVHMPVKYRRSRMRAFEGFRQGVVREDGRFHTDLRWDIHEYYLIRIGPGDTPEAVASLFHGVPSSPPDLIARQGPWILLRKAGDSFDRDHNQP